MKGLRFSDAAPSAALRASRREAMKVAVGFSPRTSAPPTPRRVAMLSVHTSPLPQPQPMRTIVRGRTVYLDGKVVGEKGWGKQALAVLPA